MKAQLIVAVLLWSILGCGHAQARDPIEITTPYFTVVSVLSEKDTRRLVEEMRIFQGVVTSFASVKDLRPQVPLRIHLVNSADWQKYLRTTKQRSARADIQV